MSEEMILNIGSEAIRTTIFLAAPLLLAAMGIGILVSVLQAITQINESTLTFIPKMVAIIVVLMLFAPWMIETLRNYTSAIFENAGDWVK